MSYTERPRSVAWLDRQPARFGELTDQAEQVSPAEKPRAEAGRGRSVTTDSCRL